MMRWILSLFAILLFIGSVRCAPVKPLFKCNRNDLYFDFENCKCTSSQECPRQYRCAGKLCVLEPNGKKDEVAVDGGEKTEHKNTEQSQVDKGRPPLVNCKSGNDSPCYTGPIGTKGVGVCMGGVSECVDGRPSGVCKNEIKPTPEICDGKDNNCNGTIDENIQESCYTGPEKTKNVGICKEGTRTCQGGKFGRCLGEVLPQPKEVCNNLDSNCDGQVDNVSGGCPCKGNETEKCYGGSSNTSQHSPCKPGIRSCKGQTWSACEGDVIPTKELCNNIDDNCNGVIDDNIAKQACSTSCGKGLKTCTAGRWSPCSAPAPKTESCNNVDDDCNGQIDESLKQTCQTPCGKGTETCERGKWVRCSASTAKTETCNGKDDDCDGVVDEGCSCKNGETGSCYSFTTGCTKKINNTFTCKGICKAGRRTCSNGKWGTCTGQSGPATEICDKKDNDCDGQTDEGGICGQCTPGATKQCGQSTGECKAGTFTCQSNRKWSTTCQGQVLPKSEVCDGKDNNCNGQIDEGNPGGGSFCTVSGKKGICAQGRKVCQNGSLVCRSTTSPRSETCNKIDDDCDGQIDEGNPGGGSSCTVTGKKGPCAKGVKNCQSGIIRCQQNVFPHTEICNGKDDDCDGLTDEILALACYDGPSGTKGVGDCVGGSKSCKAGTLSACVGQVLPKTEICDGKDTNCDGQSDTCAAGVKRCNGATRQICSADCEKWNNLVACTHGCTNGLCCACTPGSTRCSQGTFDTCAANCLSWVTGDSCQTGTCSNNKCCTCTPGAKRCTQIRKIEICASSCRSWSVYQTCPSGQICAGTRCKIIQ